MEAVLFYCFAAMILAGAFGVLLSRNIVRTAMWLLSTLAAGAGLYFLLGATFVGAVQLTIYAGGTLVLIIFGVMLTARDPKMRLKPRRGETIVAGIMCVVLAGLVVGVYLRTDWRTDQPDPVEHRTRLTDMDAPGHDGTANIGQLLLSDYLVPFEVISLLLLAVLIGSAYLARPRGVAGGDHIEGGDEA